MRPVKKFQPKTNFDDLRKQYISTSSGNGVIERVDQPIPTPLSSSQKNEKNDISMAFDDDEGDTAQPEGFFKKEQSEVILKPLVHVQERSRSSQSSILQKQFFSRKTSTREFPAMTDPNFAYTSINRQLYVTEIERFRELYAGHPKIEQIIQFVSDNMMNYFDKEDELKKDKLNQNGMAITKLQTLISEVMAKNRECDRQLDLLQGANEQITMQIDYVDKHRYLKQMRDKFNELGDAKVASATSKEVIDQKLSLYSRLKTDKQYHERLEIEKNIADIHREFERLDEQKYRILQQIQQIESQFGRCFSECNQLNMNTIFS